MKNILVPTDFSKDAGNALEFALSIANHLGSNITLLHTFEVSRPTGVLVNMEAYLRQDAEERLAEIVELAKPKLNGKAHIQSKVLEGDAVRLISDVADKHGYDLIVMGTKGAGGLKEIFIGSTTNGVMKRSKKPVLAIPAACRYRPIHKIVLALDTEDVHSPIEIRPLVELARAYNAKILVYHLDAGIDDEGIDPTIDIFLGQVAHSFHYELNSAEINDAIGSFAADQQAEMLCMIRRHRSFMEEIFHISATSQEAFHGNRPLLVLKEQTE